MARGLVAVAAVLLLADQAAAADAGKIAKEEMSWRARKRTYYLYVPTGVARDRKLPLVVTLHGSGRNGESLISKWKGVAETEKIVLVGPDSTDQRAWTSPIDGPLFLRDLVDRVASQYPIDDRRVFVFGHSGGAVFALQMGALESEYFAAVAVHAGSLQPVSVLSYAARKIPFLIFIGTRDAFFPLDVVRETRDALTSRGFPVEYVEMPGHTHDYYGSAREINAKTWEFFQKNPLPADQKYTAYQDPD
ncbi:MAG: alpha/beta hydrolase family esterase [Thermoanaerobaculia bacterium]